MDTTDTSLPSSEDTNTRLDSGFPPSVHSLDQGIVLFSCIMCCIDCVVREMTDNESRKLTMKMIECTTFAVKLHFVHYFV